MNYVMSITLLYEPEPQIETQKNPKTKRPFIIKNTGQRTFKLSSEGKYKYNFNNFALIS